MEPRYLMSRDKLIKLLDEANIPNTARDNITDHEENRLHSILKDLAIHDYYYVGVKNDPPLRGYSNLDTYNEEYAKLTLRGGGKIEQWWFSDASYDDDVSAIWVSLIIEYATTEEQIVEAVKRVITSFEEVEDGIFLLLNVNNLRKWVLDIIMRETKLSVRDICKTINFDEFLPAIMSIVEYYGDDTGISNDDIVKAISEGLTGYEILRNNV